MEGVIDFQNVSYAYEGTDEVLRNINLHLEKGRKLALVGPSGGGKTTLCHLLPNFYQLEEGNGTISIDGKDIRNLTLTSLRRNIGIVQQDVFLFAGSIRDNILYGRPDATEEEIQRIYKAKSDEFNSYPEAERMPGSWEVIQKIKSAGLTPMIVTGSGQESLLDRLNQNFPDTFRKELMVTAYDVKYGKPNPEPYLMALQKGGFKPNEAIVIENAPLGVQAGVAAGVFTLAVNTGPMPDEVLLNEGANLLFTSMPHFNEQWEDLYKALRQA